MHEYFPEVFAFGTHYSGSNLAQTYAMTPSGTTECEAGRYASFVGIAVFNDEGR